MSDHVPNPEEAEEQRKREYDAKLRERALAQAVRIIDINIPFGSLISLMVKLSFAAIPAAIIIALIWLFIKDLIMALLHK